MSSGIIETIKQVALNAFEASNPVKILFGTVTSMNPKTIKITDKLTLTEEFLTFNGEVNLDDTVTLIRIQGGQKYVVLGTRTEYVETTIYNGGVVQGGGYGNCKVYLSPSSQFQNKYAYGDTNEAEQCQKIANKTGELLANFGFSVKVGSNTLSPSERVKESNDFGATVHIPIHTNAGGGDGAMVICRSGQTNDSFVVNVYNNLCSLVNNKDDGIVVRTDLTEINKSNATVVYCECEFHDSVKGAKFIVENTDKIARAIANGVNSAAKKVYGTSGGVIDKAVAWAIATAEDSSHGYDQADRWGVDYDCSSFVISAFEQAGVALKSKGGADDTGNMYQVLLKYGFEDVTKKITLSTGGGLKKGDVLLKPQPKGHTALVIEDNGRIVHASLNEKGKITGGKKGDQTGKEICVRSYYNKPWTYVLRYKG